MSDRIVDAAYLHERLSADFATGRLFWKRSNQMQNAWNARFAGTEAFTALTTDGYKKGKIGRKIYRAHRVMWTMAHGKWPVSEIDHINGDRPDNRLTNLREVTAAENRRNMCIRNDSASGVFGVSQCNGPLPWKAQISVNGRTVHIGRFGDFEEAVAARKAAEREHGFHPNHGRPA